MIFFAFANDNGENDTEENNDTAEDEEEKVTFDDRGGFRFDGGEGAVFEHGIHGEVFAGGEIAGGEGDELTARFC